MICYWSVWNAGVFFHHRRCFTVLPFFPPSASPFSLRWCWTTVAYPLAAPGLHPYSVKLSSWVAAVCQEREESGAMPQRTPVCGSVFRQCCLSLALSETVFQTLGRSLTYTQPCGYIFPMLIYVKQDWRDVPSAKSTSGGESWRKQMGGSFGYLTMEMKWKIHNLKCWCCNTVPAIYFHDTHMHTVNDPMFVFFMKKIS